MSKEDKTVKIPEKYWNRLFDWRGGGYGRTIDIDPDFSDK